jgi:aspartyl-tRNA(Asn)/glutamyl-tRNA(Gln) amidotransferase subunit C
MSSISIDDVRYVAQLARLEMPEARLKTMQAELDMILQSIGKISELRLDDVPPTTHALEVVNVLADDVPHESLPTEQALASAPDAADGCFRVPQMRS